MKTKKCFKCGRNLPLSEFYTHPKTKDGFLNKCKECTKEDSKKSYYKNLENEEWVKKEKIRHFEKYRRLNYREKQKKRESNIKLHQMVPNHGNISRHLRSLGYDMKGKEAHHWNYNDLSSLFILSRLAHHKIHRHISVNYDDKYCYSEDGNRLETENDAFECFSSILAKYGINEDLRIVHL